MVFQACHSMKPPRPTCRRIRTSWASSRLSWWLSFSRRKVKLCTCTLLYFYLLCPPSESGPQVFCSPARVVLRGENERRGTGLVSCQLCHGDHQPHRHRKQRAAHEAPAQRDQRLSQYRPLLRDWRHLVGSGGWSMSTKAKRTRTGNGQRRCGIFWLWVPFVALCKTVTLKDNHVERTIWDIFMAVDVKVTFKVGLPVWGNFTSLEQFYSQHVNVVFKLFNIC